MEKLNFRPIREENLLTPSALDSIRGGIDSIQCTQNSCSQNSGTCTINKCVNNTLDCGENYCNTNTWTSIICPRNKLDCPYNQV